ncbi:hypothetical protein GGP41_000220 [Bipolaris sorokiniana]|uniref:AB hydrolase-1 domain-containing protein n=1 Tax=Cochliobolus sativus TaxID=45130 RepID=A0A8H6DT46_COCSA|nr:hypothetical protein GGP41_000220 [Bipolaris sorokiniana]
MPFGPFTLQWRPPTPNPPSPTPLPNGLTRTYIRTPSGSLELLSAPPSDPKTSKPPIFFAHGGFGCASVWIPYMQFFSAQGYPCYAVSYRGHGGSWYPGFWALYFTSRGRMAEDLVSGIEAVEEMEGEKRGGGQERVRVVLVAHSAGGALSQWVLGKGLIRVQGFCMFAAVPGFGSYLLATTKQVRDPFFTASTPWPVVQALERLLSPYESMLWPMQALFPIVTGPDVIQSIIGWKPKQPAKSNADKKASVVSRLFVLAAEFDVLCTPSVLLDAAKRYRTAFIDCVRRKKLDGMSEDFIDTASDESAECNGVKFEIVKGVAHHLQNHVEWEKGAEALLDWVKELD